MIIPLGNKVRAEVIDSVLGQLSDGIWENSGRMDKYWKFADVDGTNLDISDEMYDNSYNYYRNPVRNGFYGKSEKEIRDWFANKAKQVVKIWADDYGLGDVWDRNNTDVVTYMGGHVVPKITVADVYECYDFLKGRSGKKYGAAPVEEPIDEPYEVVDDVVEPKVSGGMNPSQQDLEDFFTGASTKVGRKGYIKAYTDCYIETDTGDKWTLDELKDYWNKEKANDWVLRQFDSFEDWFDTSLENFYFKPCYDDDIEACGYVKASYAKDITAYGKCIGYGVDYRNMHTAIHGILVYSDRSEAEDFYDDFIHAESAEDEQEYNYIIGDVFDAAIDNIEEVNHRDYVETGSDKIYPVYDDEFIILVNQVAVDLYM